MAFIKHGDGKIINIIKSDKDLTDEEKKLAAEKLKEINKEAIIDNNK